jgi:hypothetical protein
VLAESIEAEYAASGQRISALESCGDLRLFEYQSLEVRVAGATF